MDLTQEVIQVIENWSGTRVHTTETRLVELWDPGHNITLEIAIEILVQNLVAAFPQRRIRIAQTDLLGKSPSTCTVQDVVAAVGLSGNEDTDYKRRPPTNP